MSYRPFVFVRREDVPATPAIPATVGRPKRASVAEVAAVAGAEREIVFEAFVERAAIAEYDGGLSRLHAELLAALHTAPFGPEYDRAAIVETVAVHLDSLTAAGRIGG